MIKWLRGSQNECKDCLMLGDLMSYISTDLALVQKGSRICRQIRLKYWLR